MPRAIGNQNLDAVDSHVIDLRQQFISSIAPTKSSPWDDDIITFATHPSFCGKKLYPKQQTLLKLIYLETEKMTPYDIDVIEQWRLNFSFAKTPAGVQTDIWERIKFLRERGYHHFPHVQMVMGRRASKGMIGGVLGAERLAHMLSLDDPQDFYGIEPGKDLFVHCVATNMIQSKQFQFADIRQTVESCKYFEPYISTSKEFYLSLRTSADKRRISDMTQRKIPIEHEIATLRCLAMSSTSSSGRGSTGFMNLFDEMAHMITGSAGPRSSEEVYSAYQPSLDQFGKDSMTYIPSSPYTQVGQFYSLYQSGSILMKQYLEQHNLDTGQDIDDPDELLENLESDPEMLVVQLPSWAPYEDWEKSPKLGGPKFARAIQVYDERMKRLENRDPDKFKVERRAQFAEVEDAWLNGDKVDEMFKPFWDNRQLAPNLVSQMRYQYEAHIDPGLSNANFALCIAHLETSPFPDEYGFTWPHVIVDYLNVWQAKNYTDRTIDYVEVEQDLEQVITQFPSMKTFSADQWQSAGLLAQLKRKFGNSPRIIVEEFTEKSNQQRAEYFKSALNLGWIHSYKDSFFGDGQSLLEQELKFLSVDARNKVVKQSFGPVTTKDMFDCLSVVCERLLKENLDSWQRQLLGIPMAVGNQHGLPEQDFSGSRPIYSQSRRNLEEMKIRGSSRRLGTLAPASRSAPRHRGNRF